jgi:hypothetical protein
MTQSKPPVLATWMLDHLMWGGRNEALAGDLLEEFQRRLSADWYWRQVAGAILGFSNLLRIGWVVVWTAAFAAAWDYGLCLTAAFTAPSPPQMVSGNWIPYGGSFPLNVIGISIYLGLPLCIYLGFTHNLSLRTFGIGLGAGMLVIAALPFFEFQFATPFNCFLEYVRARHGNPVMWLQVYWAAQGAAPLIAAIWAGALSRNKTGLPAPAQQAHAS